MGKLENIPVGVRTTVIQVKVHQFRFPLVIFVNSFVFFVVKQKYPPDSSVVYFGPAEIDRV